MTSVTPAQPAIQSIHCVDARPLLGRGAEPLIEIGARSADPAAASRAGASRRCPSAPAPPRTRAATGSARARSLHLAIDRLGGRLGRRVAIDFRQHQLAIDQLRRAPRGPDRRRRPADCSPRSTRRGHVAQGDQLGRDCRRPASTRSIVSARRHARRREPESPQQPARRQSAICNPQSAISSISQNACPKLMNSAVEPFARLAMHLEAEVERASARSATCSGCRSRPRSAARPRSMSDARANTLPVSTNPTTPSPPHTGARSSALRIDQAVAADRQTRPCRSCRSAAAACGARRADRAQSRGPVVSPPAKNRSLGGRSRITSAALASVAARGKPAAEAEARVAGEHDPLGVRHRSEQPAP